MLQETEQASNTGNGKPGKLEERRKENPLHCI